MHALFRYGGCGSFDSGLCPPLRMTEERGWLVLMLSF